MEQRLMEAAQAGDIHALYLSIRDNPNILERIEEIPFVDTPFHIAASSGHTHFALEIISLKPSFGRKLNPDGLSSLDLALQKGHVETVSRLMKFNSDLIRVKGRERNTPLHYAAEADEIDILAEFLYACPESIEDLTIRDESAVHVAVKNYRLKAFDVLFGWIQRTRKREVLNWRDEEGNTVLHIAVSTNQSEVVKKLIRGKVRTNGKHLEGLTALDMALGLQWDVNNWEVRELLSHARASQASSLHNTCSLAAFLSSPERFYETKLKDIFYCQQKKELSMGLRNVALVVAALITITTYQAVLSSPGGVWQGQVINNNNPPATTNGSFSTNANATTSTTALQVNQFSSNATAGQVVMDAAYFTAFFLLNTMALTFSVVVIIIALQWHPYSSLLYVSVAYLVFSYGFSLLIISPDTVVATIFMMVSWFIYLLVFWAKMSFLKLEMELNSNVYGKRPLWMTRLQMLHSLFGGENIP